MHMSLRFVPCSVLWWFQPSNESWDLTSGIAFKPLLLAGSDAGLGFCRSVLQQERANVYMILGEGGGIPDHASWRVNFDWVRFFNH